MKKLYFIGTLILLLVFLLTNVSFATINGTASFIPDKEEAQKGEYVNVTFSISTQDDFNGFEGYLTYDKDFFTDISVTSSYNLNEGQGFSDSLIDIRSTEVIPSGTLFTVRLKVNPDTTKESGEILLSGANIYTIEDDGDLSVSPVTITLIEGEEQSGSGESQGEQENQPSENQEQQSNAGTNQSQSDTNNAKQNTANNTNQNTSPKKIPDTGKNTIIVASIAIVAIISTVTIIKFRNVIR